MHGRDALSLSEDEKVICPSSLLFFGDILRIRLDHGRTTKQWDIAEQLLREALASFKLENPLYPHALRSLSFVLQGRSGFTGVGSFIEDAVILARQALSLVALNDASAIHEYISVLATSLEQRYLLSEDPRDLKEAILLHRAAINVCPLAGYGRQTVLLRASQAFVRHFRCSGQVEDLDEALAAGNDALVSPFHGSVLQVYLLSNLANVLFVRAEAALSSQSDLDRIVELRRKALRACPDEHGIYWLCLDSLATALIQRYIWHGSWDDLEEAIQLRRHAVCSAPSWHPLQASPIASLAKNLCLRFTESGNKEDLDEAIQLYEGLVSSVPSTAPEYREYRISTVSALCLRFESFGEASDLEQVIFLSQSLIDIIHGSRRSNQIVSSIPEQEAGGNTLQVLLSCVRAHRTVISDTNGLVDDLDIPRRPRDMHCLASALLLRGRYQGTLSLLEKSKGVLQQVSNFDVVEPISGSDYLRALASSYMAKFRQHQSPRDASKARAVMKELLQLLPDGRRDRFQCLVELSELYLERGTTFRDPSKALQYLAAGVLDNHRDVRSRLQGSARLLQIIEGSHPDVSITESPQLLDIYTSVISLLPRIAFFGLDLPSRLQSLRLGHGLATVAASHALMANQPERALEVLEQGRAVFWTHALRLRSQFDMVPEELRKRLVILSHRLERSSGISYGAQDRNALEKATARRRQESEMFNALLHETRSVPGLERFMLHEEYTNLREVAAGGPVVVLIPSSVACHAVVIRPDVALLVIPLPLLTDAWLETSSSTWRSSMRAARDEMTNRLNMVKTKSKSKRAPLLRSPMDDVLEGLWTKIVCPVLNALHLSVSR
jgi:tetratricopeptide (TPR) repeat protein